MITETTAIGRILVSLILGFLIGFERSKHKHAAGARTFMLICLGSTLATLASIWICQTNMSLHNGDPGRIAAQVLTGIGFIGAGLIIKNQNDITGLTTAAGIFVTACVGVAVGVGLILTATVSTIAVIIILYSIFLFHKDKNNKNNKNDQ